MPNLILFCPNSFKENDLRDEFGAESFLLTSLGANFAKDKEISRTNIQKILSENEINSITIIQNTNCPLTEQFFNEEFEKDGVTAAKLFSENPEELTDKSMTLALLNLRSQLTFVKELLSEMDEKHSNIEVNGFVREGNS